MGTWPTIETPTTIRTWRTTEQLSVSLDVARWSRSCVVGASGLLRVEVEGLRLTAGPQGPNMHVDKYTSIYLELSICVYLYTSLYI